MFFSGRAAVLLHKLSPPGWTFESHIGAIGAEHTEAVDFMCGIGPVTAAVDIRAYLLVSVHASLLIEGMTDTRDISQPSL